MNALLSIKPEYADLILRGEKEVEFRRTVFRNPSAVDRVIMYASSPVQRILGFFSFSNVVEAGPEELWSRFKGVSGVTDREQFMAYFRGKETGYAIEIEETVSLEEPVDPWEHFDEFHPPVSFQYANRELDFVFKYSSIN